LALFFFNTACKNTSACNFFKKKFLAIGNLHKFDQKKFGDRRSIFRKNIDMSWGGFTPKIPPPFFSKPECTGNFVRRLYSTNFQIMGSKFVSHQNTKSELTIDGLIISDFFLKLESEKAVK